MERVVTRHPDRIAGIRTGVDRLRFRGTLRGISSLKGVEIWCSCGGIRLKDFGAFVERQSAHLQAQADALAQTTGRPVEDLASSAASKEERARAIRARDGITAGLIAIFSWVEACRSFTVRKDREQKRRRVVAGERRCYRTPGLMATVRRSRRSRITKKGHEVMSPALRCRPACVLARAA